MKKLIWKELMEQRLIPVAYGALAALALALWFNFNNYQDMNRFENDPREALIVLFVGVCISGLFSGSSAIAPEVGQGTLTFLTSLPAGRRGFWFAKLWAGLGIALTSVVSMAVTLFALGSHFFGPRHILAMLVHSYAAYGGWVSLVIAVVIFITVYSVSLLVSTLVRSSLVATIVSAISNVGLGLIVVTVFNLVLRWMNNIMGPMPELFRRTSGDQIFIWLLILYGLSVLGGITASLLGSYFAFCRGETLHTRKRFAIAAAALCGWMVLMAIGIVSFGMYCTREANLFHQKFPYPIADQYLGEVLIGGSVTQCVGIGPLANDTVRVGPIKAVTNDPVSFTYQVAEVSDHPIASVSYSQITSSSAGHRYITVSFNYVSRSPEGERHPTITLLSQNGVKIGMIQIHANNVKGHK